MTPERQRELASLGGRSVPAELRSFSRGGDLASLAGKKGGKVSGGNFANDRDRAVIAGRKGGAASRGNFKHNLDRASECGRMKRT